MQKTTREPKMTREERISEICELADANGYYQDSDYRLELGEEGSSDISVRDIKRGFLVAYSSTSADYDSSLEEFVGDYFLQRRT